MYVYIVMWNYSERGYNSSKGIEKIFSTKEAAEAFLKVALEENECTEHTDDGFHLEEHFVHN